MRSRRRSTSGRGRTTCWNDAADFCAKLSRQDGLKPFYFRAGTTTKYWIGDKDDELVRAGWFGGNSGGRTHAAGELKANPLGLSDMHGNVWEWVEDAWEPTNYGKFAEKPAIDPSTPIFRLFPARGPGWQLEQHRVQLSRRGVDEHIVYVVQLDDGSHITLSHAEFATRFGWKNDPENATLLKLDGE